MFGAGIVERKRAIQMLSTFRDVSHKQQTGADEAVPDREQNC